MHFGVDNILNYLMTCDVEEHSIEKNTLDDRVIDLVHNQGLPRLLDLFKNTISKQLSFSQVIMH